MYYTIQLSRFGAYLDTLRSSTKISVMSGTVLGRRRRCLSAYAERAYRGRIHDHDHHDQIRVVFRRSSFACVIS